MENTMRKKLTEEEQEKVVGGEYTFETHPFTAKEREEFAEFGYGNWVYVYKDGKFICKEMYFDKYELHAIRSRWECTEDDYDF